MAMGIIFSTALVYIDLEQLIEKIRGTYFPSIALCGSYLPS